MRVACFSTGAASLASDVTIQYTYKHDEEVLIH